jgi:hypothetical protein
MKRGIDMENRTARLTVLIDPNKKAIFDKLCALDDVNASQKVRQMIREYIEDRLGKDWQDEVFK